MPEVDDITLRFTIANLTAGRSTLRFTHRKMHDSAHCVKPSCKARINRLGGTMNATRCIYTSSERDTYIQQTGYRYSGRGNTTKIPLLHYATARGKHEKQTNILSYQNKYAAEICQVLFLAPMASPAFFSVNESPIGNW